MSAELRQVFDDLVRFETVLWGDIDARLRRDCAIGLGGLNVLLVIERVPRCRVQDIATALAVTVGGVSQAVDRVEAAGWCARRANPEDRRSSILEVTKAGTAMIAAAGAVFDEELQRLLAAPLSKGELAHLAAGLSAVRNAAMPSVAAGQRHSSG